MGLRIVQIRRLLFVVDQNRAVRLRKKRKGGIEDPVLKGVVAGYAQRPAKGKRHRQCPRRRHLLGMLWDQSQRHRRNARPFEEVCEPADCERA